MMKKMRPQNFTAIRLVPDIRLRREFFGGLVYDTRNGNILEVDRGAFQFLRLIKDRALDLNDIIAFLVQNNIIKKFDKSIYLAFFRKTYLLRKYLTIMYLLFIPF